MSVRPAPAAPARGDGRARVHGRGDLRGGSGRPPDLHADGRGADGRAGPVPGWQGPAGRLCPGGARDRRAGLSSCRSSRSRSTSPSSTPVLPRRSSTTTRRSRPGRSAGTRSAARRRALFIDGHSGRGRWARRSGRPTRRPTSTTTASSVATSYGTLDDGVPSFTDPDNMAKLGPAVASTVIDGGNHEQMGWYTGQPERPAGDDQPRGPAGPGRGRDGRAPPGLDAPAAE